MNKTLVYAIALAIVTLLSCSGQACHSNQSKFVSYAQFLGNTKAAKFADYAHGEHARVRDAAAFEEMRNHILSMYDGVKQESSFFVDGNYCDCIRTDTQPSLSLQRSRQIAQPPQVSKRAAESGKPAESEGKTQHGGPPGLDVHFARSVVTLGKHDEFGNQIACADGTIPMARLTLEWLTRFETLAAFLSKDGKGGHDLHTSSDPAPNSSGTTDWVHANAIQHVTNFGGNSWLNLWSPVVTDWNQNSVSQQWYMGHGATTFQTVEGGWLVNQSFTGTKKATLFIFSFVDSSTPSANCFNLTCKGFVQTSNHSYLGGSWDHYSSPGGEQWGFEMQWKYFQGNWWLFLKGSGDWEAIGYYPGSLYGGGPLATSADEIEYGGEVTGINHWSEMGSGQFADQGWTNAAFQNDVFYIAADENDGFGIWADLTEVEDSPSCFTCDVGTLPNGGPSTVYLYFGGPGGSTCP